MPFRLETTVVKEGSIADMYKMEGIDLEQEISDLDPISDKTVKSVSFKQPEDNLDNFAQKSLQMWYTVLEDVGREGGVPTLYKTKAEAEARDKFLRSKIFPRRIINFYYGIDWNYTVRYAPKSKIEEWSSLSEEKKQEAFQEYKKKNPKLASEAQELRLKMFEAVVPTHDNLEYYSPTAKEIREIYNKCDYIRLTRPKNNIGWYMITKKEFQASVGQLNAYWGLKIPTEMGDYEYSKRTGMWLATNRVKQLEKQGQIPLACTITWLANEEKVSPQTLTKWQKFLLWLKNGWNNFKNKIHNAVNKLVGFTTDTINDFKKHIELIWNGLVKGGFGGMFGAMATATQDHIDSILQFFNGGDSSRAAQSDEDFIANNIEKYKNLDWSNGQIVEGIINSFNNQLRNNLGKLFTEQKFLEGISTELKKTVGKIEDCFISISPEDNTYLLQHGDEYGSRILYEAT